MKKLLALTLLACACTTTAPQRPTTSAPQGATPAVPQGPVPPVARREPHPTTVHGVTLQDDYFWLRNKDTPEVLEYLKAENAYSAVALDKLAPLREQLYQEMVAREAEDFETPPVKNGAWWYLQRQEKGKQYPTLLRRKGGPSAPDEVMLDLNQLAEGKKFLGFGRSAVSDDGTLLAYSVDETGFRQYELRIKDLVTGHTGLERIPRVTSLAWAADGKTLFYSQEHAQTKRSYQVFRHALGATGRDELVYEEPDERFDVHVYRSRDRELLFVASESHTQSEVRWIPARAPLAPAKLVEPRAPELEYDCDHREGSLWCRTNAGGRNFRLVRARIGTPELGKWPEAVPHRDDALLEAFDLFRDFAVVTEVKAGIPTLRVLDLKQKDPYAASFAVEMPEPAYTASPTGNLEFDTSKFRFGYQSPITPQSWFDYDVAARTRTLVKEKPVPTYDRTKYQVERLEATAPDGVKVPITVISKRGVPRDGTAPLHVSGYGSYGYSFPLTFSDFEVSNLDRGVVSAIAHIRGGSEMGKKWHDDGRMLKKRNTFTDFIAVVDTLVAQKVGARERTVISGGSAGGLLMGAVINLRPDLCRAAQLMVPFVDVMNTMLDKTLPLTVAEFEEWGNPEANKAEFDYMLSYSPYDNLRDVKYPDLLVKSSYNDSQVMYWEPTKYVARMRATRHDGGEVLLKVNLDPAGHGGASGRYDRLRERAEEQAWQQWKMGLFEPK